MTLEVLTDLKFEISGLNNPCSSAVVLHLTNLPGKKANIIHRPAGFAAGKNDVRTEGVAVCKPRLCDSLFSSSFPSIIGILTPQKSKPELGSKLPYMGHRVASCCFSTCGGNNSFGAPAQKLGWLRGFPRLHTSVVCLQDPMERERAGNRRSDVEVLILMLLFYYCYFGILSPMHLYRDRLKGGAVC